MTTRPPLFRGSIRPGVLVRIVTAVALLAALFAAYELLQETGALAVMLDGQAVRRYIMELGPVGPLAVVALMALAVLVSPLPSAPVALAAGALYGHTWGTLYVLTGAILGALGAFSLARLLGRDALHRWFGDRLPRTRLGTQNSLMGLVFVSRLMPFISFDIVSYAAGLTPLALWRFALATLVGVLPTSFLLAHFGGEMVSGELDRMLYAVLVLGLLTAVPLGAYALRERLRGGAKRSRPG